MVGLNSLRGGFAGKAKYKRMIELGKTMLLVYVNLEPMLSMMIYQKNLLQWSYANLHIKQ